MLSSDGSAAKLGCYEGIALIVKEEEKSGVAQIEKHLDDLQSCPDQQLLKCLCLQLLSIYYTDLNEYSISSQVSKKAIKVCEKIGNYNLCLISNCEQSTSPGHNERKGEQLILFIYLLFFWSQEFISDDTRMHFFNLLHRLEEGLGNRSLDNSHYILSVVMYCDSILAVRSKMDGQENFFLNEKINFLDKSLKSDFIHETCPRFSEAGKDVHLRLLNCYKMKMTFLKEEQFSIGKSFYDIEIETCRKALDLSLKRSGKQQEETALWYFEMGLTEITAENYSAALEAFDQVLECLETRDDRNSINNDMLANAHLSKGEVCFYMSKFESATESFEKALGIRRKLYDEETKEILEVLYGLGIVQYRSKDLTSALATNKRALNIMMKLHADKCYPSIEVLLCYCRIVQVHQQLGNNTESVNALKTALEMEADCNDGLTQCCIFSYLIHLDMDESLYMKCLNGLYINRKEHNPMLAIMLLKLAAKQLESEKCKDGLVTLEEALNIELEDTLLSHFLIREVSFTDYLEVAIILVNIEKYKLAKRAVGRATKIAESLPKCKQHLYVFRCYSLKGRIDNKMQEYVAAIESLDHALLQLPKLSHDAYDKIEELECYVELAKAYWFETSYVKALTCFYDALFTVKEVFPEGSKIEGNLYRYFAAIANRMKN